MAAQILIVDDEKDITESLKAGLGLYGFQVDVYNDPSIALANYKTNKYDIAILDIKMPKISGFELYREMKKIDGQTSYCFFTAFDIYEREFERIFPDTAVKTFIKKPITASELASQLNKLLANRREISAQSTTPKSVK